MLPPKMMTGASQAHDRAAVNIIAALHRQLRGGPCRPTTDDLAVRIPAGNIRRPDVTIECGQAGRRDMAVRDPRIVIEVLSPSTMSFDRFKKVLEYQTVATLTHILLVDTEGPRIDVLARSGTETWTSTRYEGLDAKIDLPDDQGIARPGRGLRGNRLRTNLDPRSHSAALSSGGAPRGTGREAPPRRPWRR